MLVTQLAKKYARAIFEVAVDEQKLGEFGADLTKVAQTIVNHAELAAFIGNPQIKAEAKKAVFAKLFKAEVSTLVYNFFMLLIDKHRESLLQDITQEYKILANAAQNIVEATVTVASDLSKTQEERLIQKLQITTGKTVVIETKIDQRILGGMVIQIGDKLIDGSVTRQMQMLKKQLLAN